MTEAIQSTYSRYHAPAFEGQIADLQLSNSFSRRCDTELPFGKVVVQGADDDSVKLPDAGGVFQGITTRDQSTGAKSPNSYPANSMARLLDKGTIWVTVGGNVSAGDAAAFLDADGSLVVSGTASSTAITGAKFDTSAANGELAILKLA